MPNVPRRQKAPAGKYEGKAFLDYDEAADYLGIKRTTLYHHVVDLEIETHKFRKNTRKYLAIADVKQIERVIEEPWSVTDRTEDAQSPSVSEESTSAISTLQGGTEGQAGEIRHTEETSEDKPAA